MSSNLYYIMETYAKKILIFGDSITYGAWDKSGGWVDRLKKYFHKKVIDSKGKSDFIVYNLGVDGDDSESLVKRFKFEAQSRLYDSEEMIFIFAIGINDSIFIKGKNNPVVSTDRFKGNIKKLIQLSFQFSAKPVFVGLSPVDEVKTNPIPWSKTGKCYKNEYVKKYDDMIESVCAENKVGFVEIYGKFASLDYKKLLDDGLHPNSEGHKMIFEIVRDYIGKNL